MPGSIHRRTDNRAVQVWVTARASDDVLCFTATRLVTDPSYALVAVVRVGEAPVGLTAVRDGTLIMVADHPLITVPGSSAFSPREEKLDGSFTS